MSKKSPTFQEGESGATGSMGFSWREHEETCSVGEYLTDLVIYVNRKNAPLIEIILRQACYQTALSL